MGILSPTQIQNESNASLLQQRPATLALQYPSLSGSFQGRKTARSWEAFQSFYPFAVDVPVDFPSIERLLDDLPSTSRKAVISADREPGMIAKDASMCLRQSLALASQERGARATSSLNVGNQLGKRRRISNSPGGMVRSSAIPYSLFSLGRQYEALYYNEPQKQQESTKLSLEQATKFIKLISSPISHQQAFDNCLTFPTLSMSAPRLLTPPLA
jgi:hypothetical protein